MESLKQILNSKIMSFDILRSQVDIWRTQGMSIVFTNGVFDLVHKGHIIYLSKAKELGDKLIIGLNTDSSVKRLKGNDRPINDQDCRSILLAALCFTDAITVFEEDTPLHLIKTIKPDILVKGADYALSEIIGAEEVSAYGGKGKTIELVAGASSTALIDKIRGH